MAVPLTRVGAITMFVEDPERSKSFYERVFDASPVYQDENSVAFEFDNTIVNLLKRPAAHELIAPASVAGADAACALLEERGVTLLNGPMDRAWGMRTAAFTDPDGHVWEVAQGLSQAEEA